MVLMITKMTMRREQASQRGRRSVGGSEVAGAVGALEALWALALPLTGQDQKTVGDSPTCENEVRCRDG